MNTLRHQTADQNQHLLSLAPEIDALGLGDRVGELGAEGPVDATDLIGFRQGLADGTPVPDHSASKSVIAPREGVTQELRHSRGYTIDRRVAGLLQTERRDA